VTVGDIVPVIKCHDVRAAERFYCGVLGGGMVRFPRA
jgi:hypothetical protein